MSKFAIYGSITSGNGNTSTVSSFKPRTARAYCDGRQAHFSALLLTDNPFTIGRERENKLAWDAGWTDHSNGIAAAGTHCAPSF